ncbi:hypothetical protein MKW94_001120 [Papaver nudicaule]|uniref:Dirigent protein n=1 Tax=Papaver nudicaule TaxID=74823 RepID=A0AA41VFM6_PAPNU|nr:hypothetical protein [Papaver nudicaule]
MKAKIIFCTAVSVATLAVILLALVSPVAHKKLKKTQPSNNAWLALSLYIQRPHSETINQPKPRISAHPGAYVFHRTLTEGPENTSRIVGKAQGFILPIEHFAHSAFNIIYLTFDTPEFSGSISMQAKHIDHKAREELTVVGGTGSFAFARGLASFAQMSTDSQESDVIDARYQLKLRLKFPHQVTRTVPG